MSSVQESETGSGFINAKEAVPTHTILQDMDHKKGPTPLQFDNTCAVDIITDTIIQCRSKVMDLQFYWIGLATDRDKTNSIFTRYVLKNLDDYPTKHHSTKHHIAVGPTYIQNNVKNKCNTYRNKTMML